MIFNNENERRYYERGKRKARKIQDGFRKIAGVAHVTYDKCFAGDIFPRDHQFQRPSPAPTVFRFPFTFSTSSTSFFSSSTPLENSSAPACGNISCGSECIFTMHVVETLRHHNGGQTITRIFETSSRNIITLSLKPMDNKKIANYCKRINVSE